MGVPLINAIYESDPLVGLYTLPLLIWHPMQLVLGSFLAPRLAAFVESEMQRLGVNEEDGADDTPVSIVPQEAPLQDSEQIDIESRAVKEQEPKTE
jgi:hypothetical protein